jgi:hypothetical protein
MKKLLITFLMAIVATAPFSFNTLVADSHITNPSFDLPEEDPLIMRMEEMKKAGKGTLVAEDFPRLIDFFIHESDQVIFVDLRKEYDGIPEYWEDRFHGQFNQSSHELEQNENESECLSRFTATLHKWIEDDEFQASQFNLDTLRSIAERDFVDDIEHRYVRFQTADGTLDNTLLTDQFLEYFSGLSINNEFRIDHLPSEETNTTIFCFHDYVSVEKLDYKQYKSNYASRHASNSGIPAYESTSKRSSFADSRSKSDSLYNRLHCAYSYGVEGSFELDGNGNINTTISAYGKIADEDGNCAHGELYYNTDGRTGGRGGVYRESEREKERNRNR